MQSMMFGAVLLLCAGVAWGEDITCFYPARPLGSQFFYHHSVSPSQFTDPNCAVVPKADTPAQRALTADRSTWKYLKVNGGLAVVMTAGEQTAVNTFLVNKAAAQKAFQDKVDEAGVCKFDTLAEVAAALATRKANRQALLDTAETTLQAQIDAFPAGTVTQARIIAALTQFNTVLFNVAGGLLDEDYLLAINLASCDFARSKVGR